MRTGQLGGAQHGRVWGRAIGGMAGGSRNAPISRGNIGSAAAQAVHPLLALIVRPETNIVAIKFTTNDRPRDFILTFESFPDIVTKIDWHIFQHLLQGAPIAILLPD